MSITQDGPFYRLLFESLFAHVEDEHVVTADMAAVRFWWGKKLVFRWHGAGQFLLGLPVKSSWEHLPGSIWPVLFWGYVQNEYQEPGPIGHLLIADAGGGRVCVLLSRMLRISPPGDTEHANEWAELDRTAHEYWRGLMPAFLAEFGGGEAMGTRAKRLGVQPKRLKRWDRIRGQHIPRGLTQQEIATAEDVSLEAIKADFRDMREKGVIPS